MVQHYDYCSAFEKFNEFVKVSVTAAEKSEHTEFQLLDDYLRSSPSIEEVFQVVNDKDIYAKQHEVGLLVVSGYIIICPLLRA